LNVDNARIALECLDLTSLQDNDDPATVDALISRALGSVGPPAALCIWPHYVAQARALLPRSIRLAAVANFPRGESAVQQVLSEVQAIMAAGADEIDLVLPWRKLSQGDSAGAAALVHAVRTACPGHTLKLIIESGELGTPDRIGQACRIGLEAGVDFLKTSTGKTPVGATPEAARVMLESIASHPRREQTGFKASGGIRTVDDATIYIDLVREILGEPVIHPTRLRFGASALLNDIEAVLHRGAAKLATQPGDY